ncbi:MAG: response regulator [Chloroflexi bacterium]|nr:response regulator [Chloroflexota bacterium]
MKNMTEKAKILVVEDENIVALDIKNMLEGLGYRVPALVSSGERAIQKADEIRPDLVLMDIQLKQAMNGVEAARQIRTRFDIPVIYLTAYADDKTVQKAKETEPFGYILKPLEERELHTNIEIALYRHKMEQRLKESERWLSTTLKSIGDAVIATDAQGRIVFMNPVAEKLTGWKQEQALDKDSGQVFQVFDEETRQPLENPVTQVLQKGTVVDLENDDLLVRKDGSEIFIGDSAAPIRGEKGTIDGVVLVFRDVTERRRAKEALRQRNHELALLNQASQVFSSTLDLDEVLVAVLEEVRCCLNVLAVSVWLTDLETNELVCQQAVGPNSKAVRGWRLMPGEGIAGWVTSSSEPLIVADAQADARYFDGVDQITGLTPRSLLTVPLRVKQQVIGVLQVVDTTVDRFTTADWTLLESLAASAAISIANARLVDMLHRQTVELKVRNDDLNAFAHTVAHDLKSPLSVVVGYAEMLKEALWDKHNALTDEQVRHSLHEMTHTGRKMSNIVDELLMLSAVRQAEVQLTPVDLASTVAGAQQRLAYMIRKHQAEIIVNGDWPAALGHAPWIEEVWVNYLSNAIKYGGRPLRIELGATAQRDDTVRFWIRDNGTGISAEAQARLFTPFTRLDQVRADGHGLGLSIVQRIIEKLGGQVGVESEVGQGSTFFFTLQTEPASQVE